MIRILKLFEPNLAWLRQYSFNNARHDLIAGFVSSLIIIPQAAALASLAGMPPQYGIYASIIPVIVAALWGSSWQSLSGPNTAVALMISAAIFPFANLETELYISLVLTLTLIVGLIQLTMACLQLGSLLKFVSPAVITGITNAVGILIIVSAGWGLLGVHNMIEWHFLTKLNQLAHDIVLANPYAAGVGVFTLVAGFSLRLVTRRFYLVIAMFIGIGFSWLLNWALGSETTGIEVLGNLSIDSFQMVIPKKIEAVYVLQQLLLAGFAIAIVGALQATVIARAIADRSGQLVDKNKELIGQGMANVVGSFFMSFAGSSSFNRSIVHYQAGAKTPLAAVISALLLIGFVFLGHTVISIMPIAVMSAVLIMVGWRLIDLREFRRIFHLRSEAIIFYLTFTTALMFGLTDAVFLGMVSSLFVYLRGVINPNVTLMEEDNGNRHVLQLRGHLFFATLTHLTSHVHKLITLSGDRKATLVIDLREVTYIDWAAIRLLRRIGQDWRANGGKFVIRVLDNQQEKTLGIVNQISKIGGERQVA